MTEKPPTPVSDRLKQLLKESGLDPNAPASKFIEEIRGKVNKRIIQFLGQFGNVGSKALIMTIRRKEESLAMGSGAESFLDDEGGIDTIVTPPKKIDEEDPQ